MNQARLREPIGRLEPARHSGLFSQSAQSCQGLPGHFETVAILGPHFNDLPLDRLSVSHSRKTSLYEELSKVKIRAGHLLLCRLRWRCNFIVCSRSGKCARSFGRPTNFLLA